MKRKELKHIAEKIAKAEFIIQNSDDKKAITRAQNDILTLSNGIGNLNDIITIDEMVQEILSKKI